MKITILRSFYRLASLLLLLISAGQVNATDIYAYIDTQGNLLISEKKENARYVRFDPKRRIAPKIPFDFSSRPSVRQASWVTKRVETRFAPQTLYNGQTVLNIPIHSKAVHYSLLVNGIAEEVGVNANLLHAIIQIESAYNPEATSPKGAQGLMQLIPATAERFGVKRSYDPEANVRGGARYLKDLLARFDNNLQLALAAYNAGEGTVQKYNNTIPPYPETQTYVRRVLSLFAQRGQ